MKCERGGRLSVVVANGFGKRFRKTVSEQTVSELENRLRGVIHIPRIPDRAAL